MKAYRLPVLLLAPATLAAIAMILLFRLKDDGMNCTATGSTSSQVTEVKAGSGSVAIQRAIDAASRNGGGIIQLTAGRFDIHRPLILKDNVALRGSGSDTVLKAASDFLEVKGPHGGHPLITTDGAKNVTIGHLTADQSGDKLNGNTRGRLNEYLIDVRHSTNAVVEGIFTRNPFTYSLAVVGSYNFCIRENSTVANSSGKYDQLDGIHITDSHSGVVVRNHVDQGQGEDGDDGLVAQTIGAAVHDVVYRDNDVRGGPHGAAMQLAVSGHEIYNITIENNRFWGSPLGVHTGYYEGEDQAVHDVVVRNNVFLNLEGHSTNFYGKLENIEVSNNQVCRSGNLLVADGLGNVIKGTVASCELKDQRTWIYRSFS